VGAIRLEKPRADRQRSRAILDMKIQRDKLHQYQKRITVVTTREKEIAKECLARGDKDKALLALRRRKYQESLLTKTDAQLEQLEKLTSSVEFALVQKDVVFGLQQGTQVLKQIRAEMGGLEAVEKLMGESEEARAYQQVRSAMPRIRLRFVHNPPRKRATISKGFTDSESTLIGDQ
jgi:charged multivesicular body protein 6